jgi:hypothetical protein
MTTEQVAERYYELAQQNKWNQIQDELYADNIVCLEPPNSKSPPRTEGKEAVVRKAQHFQNLIETVHSGYSTRPNVAGNLFSVGMGMDITMKGLGRSKFDEIGVFTVENGKIVQEEFVMQWSYGGGHDYKA